MKIELSIEELKSLLEMFKDTKPRSRFIELVDKVKPSQEQTIECLQEQTIERLEDGEEIDWMRDKLEEQDERVGDDSNRTEDKGGRLSRRGKQLYDEFVEVQPKKHKVRRTEQEKEAQATVRGLLLQRRYEQVEDLISKIKELKNPPADTPVTEAPVESEASGTGGNEEQIHS